MRLLFFSTILFFYGLLSAQPKTVAVLYFDNNSIMDAQKYDGLKKGLCDILITELSKMNGLRVVERENLQKIMQEIALGQSGIIEESSAPQVGKLLGADVLTFGSFVCGMGGEIRIDMRMVETESGKVLRAQEVSGSAKSLFKLIKKLTFKIAAQLNIEASKSERAKIKSTNLIGIDALVVYSEGLELLDSGDTAGALKKFQSALIINPDFTKAHEQITRLNKE